MLYHYESGHAKEEKYYLIWIKKMTQMENKKPILGTGYTLTDALFVIFLKSF